MKVWIVIEPLDDQFKYNVIGVFSNELNAQEKVLGTNWEITESYVGDQETMKEKTIV